MGRGGRNGQGPPGGGKDWVRRVPLSLVRLASHLVPPLRRRDWIREWEAELMAHGKEDDGRNRGQLRTGLTLGWRALGSFVDAWSLGGGRPGEGWVLDLRRALRGARKRPSFSLVVVLTLAVGIGANTAIFGLAREMLLKPFPYPDPEGVVHVGGYAEGRGRFGGNVSYPNMADLSAAAASLQGVAATRWWHPALTTEGEAVVLRGAIVTSNFFRILGVRPGAGRFFRAEEEGTGRPPIVVLSHQLWMSRFGGDPAVVGSTLRLNGTGYEVVGVTGPDFEDPGIMGRPGAQPGIWTTVASPPSEWPRSGRSWRGLARLGEGVALSEAQAEVNAVAAGLREAFPEDNPGRQFELTPLLERVAGPSRPVLLALIGSVGLLLLVACANLANLFLSRSLDRQGELGLEKALGASGSRLARGAFLESGLYALLGGAAGVALALGLSWGIETLGPLVLPRPYEGGVDGGFLALALAFTMGTGVLFGMAPAVQAMSVRGANPFMEEDRTRTGGRRIRLLQRGLVVTEMALTTVLLISAGLMLRSFQNLGRVELGMEIEGVTTLELHGSAWWDLEPEAAAGQWSEVLDAVRGIPGVLEAGAMDYVPLGGSFSCDGVGRADRPRPPPGEGRCAETRSSFPGALEALSVPVLRGRSVSQEDRVDGPPTVAIDETMAEGFWPGEDPLGKPLYVHGRVHTVVGVVGDVGHFGPGGVRRPTVYIPAPQEGWNGAARGLTLVVKSRGEAGDLIPAVRYAVWGVNPRIAFGDISTLEELLSGELSRPRFRSFLLLAFGITGILLTALGIGGVMSHSVARRTREMGIRLALGAAPGGVRSLIVKEGLALTAVGVSVGLAGAVLAARLLDSLLFEVTAGDPLVFSFAPLLVMAAGVLACVIPAWRASGVDITRTLAGE